MFPLATTHYGSAAELVRQFPGVTGLGFGLRESSGAITSDRVWRIYVARKHPVSRLTRRQRLPGKIFEIPTDVLQVCKPRCSAGGPSVGWSSRAQMRPPHHSLTEGMAIANDKGVPGTLGGLARIHTTGQLVMLSNYHILFARNAQPDDRIWSVGKPGVALAPIGKNYYGKVGVCRDSGSDVFIDAAIGHVDDSLLDTLPAGPKPTPGGDSCVDAELGRTVSKVGAATGRTDGVVVDICYPDRWHWEYRSENAPRQILLRSTDAAREFSRTGDSGAMIRDQDGNIVGLLWGSNARGEGIACPIAPVRCALGIDFADLPILEVA